MSNKKQEQFDDVTKYGYLEDVKVEIPGQLLYSMMKLLGRLLEKEVSVQHIVDPHSINATAQPQNARQVISVDGISYAHFLGELEGLHRENVKAGKTRPIEEVEAKLKEKIDAIMKEVQSKKGAKIVPLNPKKKNKK